ncbi:MAG TPA: diguanylate cyclase [Thermomicrobiales bacterium]|jgi:diguanylate cyclase (GGDEF)-like protein/PAS domain S-box-containing protein|nr:diguanylate cyclase [Thermomicrobiales bacterium]
MFIPRSESKYGAALPIVGLCILAITLRLCSTLTLSHFYDAVSHETDRITIQESLIRQIERYQRVEESMIAARSLPVVPLDAVIAGTNQSISDLAVREPDDADQVRPLFEQYAADLRAEADLIANGQIDAAIALRQSGSLASGSAVHERLTALHESASARKAEAQRKVKVMLIVPTALGSVFVCTVFITYDQRRKRAYSLLAAQETRFRSLIQQSTDIVLVADIHGAITYATPAAEHAFGRSAAQLRNTELADFVLPDDRGAVTDLILEAIARDGQPSRGEVRFLLSNRVPRTMEVTAVNLIENEAVQGIVITAHDITERKMLLESLRHQAHHDSLTGLPNRLVLEDRLDSAIRQAQSTGVPTSVLFIDLNDFKMINDRDGHAMGDELLVAAADRLRETLRIDDTLARIGGDEFVVLLDGMDRDYAVRVAERLTEALAELPVRERILGQGASIGITVIRDNELPADIVLKHADSAMYAVKATGKTGWHVFGEPVPGLISVA